MPKFILIPCALVLLAVIKPQTHVWMRLGESAKSLQLEPNGKFLAYIPQSGMGLKILNLKNKYIYAVSTKQIGNAFFWAPGGYRLFYRELHFAAEKTYSELRVYDVGQLKSHLLEKLPSSSGMPTFDPRDLTFQLMYNKGIKVKKIYYPNNRLAKWQVGRRTRGMKWLATPKGMLVVKDGGKSYAKLADDDSGLASFSIASKGQAVLWGTNAGNIYLQRDEGEVRYVARGRDPCWHPLDELYVYSKARYVGQKLVDYDLYFADMFGRGRYLTHTPFSRERYAVWRNKGKQLLFTREKTTDIFAMNLTPTKKQNKTVAVVPNK